jgi:DNA (cytosine-5)-methyltransferase 1
MLKVFEAFAGIGSQRAALRNIGIPHEVVGISEIDKRAIKAYNRIHGPTHNYGDISKIDPTTLPDFDLFTYSFPCTDLSRAGYQKGLEGTRSGLLYECKKIIETKLPKYLLLENVPDLVGSKFKDAFEKWLLYLSDLGYTTYWNILNARDYGVPQTRSRVFAVSIRGDEYFEFPKPTGQAIFLDVKEKGAVGVDRYGRPGNLFHICPSMQRAIKDGKCKIINDNGLASCLTTKQQRWNNGGFVHEWSRGIRYLSGLEQMRLMGFNDSDFEKIKDFPTTHIDFLCGNSIVVKVLEGIFRNLLIPQQAQKIA